tara:strand:+ start:4989 stop:5564 length:576 start_codon:yes stop_codon:yes gene_type:complete
MKYIYNPVTGVLDETAKIGEKKFDWDKQDKHTIDTLNKFEDSPSIEEHTASQKQLEKLSTQTNYGGKLWKSFVANNEESKKNSIDLKRPSFSDSDVIFASMDPKEALEFTGGDPEKIKLMRSIKAKVHRQNDYDKRKKIASDNNKRIIRGTPVELDKNIDQIIAEPVKPDLIKRRDPDLDRGIASLFKEKF